MEAGGGLDTHVLVGPDEEAVVDVSLHQARLADTLLAQHDHFGVDPHRTHPGLVWTGLGPGPGGMGWDGNTAGETLELPQCEGESHDYYYYSLYLFK